jgi:hypothetical protein
MENLESESRPSGPFFYRGYTVKRRSSGWAVFDHTHCPISTKWHHCEEALEFVDQIETANEYATLDWSKP